MAELMMMVDLYLGILRFRKQDFEGALSAFRSAMTKDRGSFLIPVERNQAQKGSDNADRYLYEDDWALLQILSAKYIAGRDNERSIRINRQ